MTPSISEFYKGRRCLVTGGNGFVGKRLCRRLQDLGAVVDTADRAGNAREHQNCDVKNLYQVREIFSRFNPDTVFHLAARTEVRASLVEPLDTYRTNVMGTLNVLEVCRERKTPALVVASSDKAYGDAGMGVKETTPLCSNADIYSASKCAADELAQIYSSIYGMAITILRPVNIYGPGQTNDTTLITSSVKKILRGELPVIHNGSRYSRREWIFIDDVVSAYLLAGMNRKNLPEPAYNVGSRDVYSVEAVVRAILSQMGKGTFDFDLHADTCPQIGHQSVDSSKFRETYPEWTTVPFTDGLRRTIEWMRGGL